MLALTAELCKILRKAATLGQRLLDVKEVAEYLGVSERSVRYLYANGLLDIVRVGSLIRVRAESLHRQVTSQWETRGRR